MAAWAACVYPLSSACYAGRHWTVRTRPQVPMILIIHYPVLQAVSARPGQPASQPAQLSQPSASGPHGIHKYNLGGTYVDTSHLAWEGWERTTTPAPPVAGRVHPCCVPPESAPPSICLCPTSSHWLSTCACVHNERCTCTLTRVYRMRQRLSAPVPD